jgi:hypothetical protein
MSPTWRSTPESRVGLRRALHRPRSRRRVPRALGPRAKNLWITCIREYETDRLIGWQEKNKRHFNNYPKHMEKSSTSTGSTTYRTTARGRRRGVPAGLPLHPVAQTSRVPSPRWVRGSSDTQLDILVERFDVLISALDNDKSGDQTNADLRQRVGGRANLRFWNYGRTRSKDPGEQTYREARESYKTAYSSILARF